MSQTPLSTDPTLKAPVKPIRCLVIQLARLGDTLQSLMALRAAKQLYPQLQITFVARERFADAAKRVAWIDNVITLPTEALVSGILKSPLTSAALSDKTPRNTAEDQGLREAARWMIPLVREPWDLVVNWSYSEASSYLTGLMPGRVKLGFSRRKDLSLLSADGWSHYMQAIVQGGLAQNIHLTDIFTTQLLTALQIHIGEPDPATVDGNAAVTSKSFFTLRMGEKDLGVLDRQSSRKWMALQIGASKAHRSWSSARWAAFIQQMLRKSSDYSLVLLGSANDRAMEREILSILKSEDTDARRVISLVGQTDFDLWASIVSRAHWLVSGDSSATHLASVLGTRVLNLAMGGVRWGEVGPYGNGHYVITSSETCIGCETEKGEHSCGETISPEAVYAVWAYASTEWMHRRQLPLESQFSKLGYDSHLAGVNVYRGRIRDTDAGGGLIYEPILRRPMTYTEWTALALGHMARSWYCGWVPAVGSELKRDRISPRLITRLRTLDEAAKVLSKIYSEACLTALSLKKKSERLRSDKVMGLQDRNEVRELAKKLFELDELIERMGKTEPPLLAFSRLSKVLMHNLHGDHLVDLGQESAECYRQLNEGVGILREWLKHTLELAKPMAISASQQQTQKGELLV